MFSSCYWLPIVDTIVFRPGEFDLDPKDEKLLEDEAQLSHGDAKRSKLHQKIQSWMRKPDYISTEQTRFQVNTKLQFLN